MIECVCWISLNASCVIEVSQDSGTEEEIAMRTRVLSMFVMALALLIGAHLAAAQEMGKATAKLTGAAEVPGPGDPKGSGTVQVTLDPAKGEVCYELSVADIQEATAAHIHEGAMGKEGPVKLALDAPKTGSAKGCKSADAAVIKAMMQDPDDYYVNVHNAAFPKGAVRGQLSK
jgi:CHRD domain-containing protein